MSDMLLVGVAPTSEEGKEFFLHCNDWWYEILDVFIFLLADIYPMDEYFARDLLLAPPTPTMNAEESLKFSVLVNNILQDGTAKECLRMIYHIDPIYSAYYGEDEKLINDNINDRIEQIEALAKFLQYCGGCAAKWYIAE